MSRFLAVLFLIVVIVVYVAAPVLRDGIRNLTATTRAMP